MDYIGSKVKLNEWLFDIIGVSSECPKETVFLDACSGSGAVSKYAAKAGYQIVSNDLMKFASVIVNGSIGLTQKQIDISLAEIKRLNTSTGLDGYFYNHFCDESSPPRLYFTANNARLIDQIREEIDLVSDPKIRDYLLYCGLEAISRVSNTTGVQAAFLKSYKDRAKDTFTLTNERVIQGTVKAFSRDILSLLRDNRFRRKYREDVLYIDPPYNQRQYGPNYHLYETFVRNDNPQARGKTGLRNWKDECSSAFCSRRTCLEFLKSVVKASTAQ